jgi:hypothetical protein
MASQTEELEDNTPLISLKQESEDQDSGVEIQAAPLEENKEDKSDSESDAESTAESTKDEDEEEDPDLNLGDRILVETKKYGKVVGRIYYIDDTLLRVLPDGSSNRLYDFPISEGELDPDLGVTDIIIDKGPGLNFVDFSGFREGQIVDSYTAKEGTFVKSYKILSVNQADDSIQVRDKDEVDPEFKIQFANGIPRDLPFAVLRVAPIGIAEDFPKGSETEAEAEESQESEGDFDVIGELVIPTFLEVTTISAKDQDFPDIVQINDFLRDLISMFDAPSQKNPLYLKRVRAIVEMANIMKHAISRHSESGKIIGQENPSVQSLADIVRNRDVPLVRPVLLTKRVLQVDEIAESDQSEKETDQLIIHTLSETIARSNEWAANHDLLPPGEEGVDIPRFYQWMRSLLTRFPMGDKYLGDQYSFSKDGEYFRQEAPTTAKVEGLPSSEGTEVDVITDEYVGTVKQSLRRGMGPTLRKGPNGGIMVSVPGSSADVKSYALFPPTVNRQLGTTRSGKLYEDIIRSHMPLESMIQLIESLGSITEVEDAGKILLLKADEASLANVKFHEYLETILPLSFPKGAGDSLLIMKDLGLDDKELNIDQSTKIQDRVKQIIIRMRAHIRKLRASADARPSVSNPLLDEGDNSFIERLNTVVGVLPMLKEALSDLNRRTPGYRKIDIAIMGYLLNYYPDLTFAALGNSDKNLERERIRSTRDTFLKALRSAKRITQLAIDAGSKPIVNPCVHVDALTKIRKLKDDSQRQALLTKFISRFKGSRKDNWIECAVCDQHLLCHHEVLQIQQYRHPRENDVIQKEIILHYAGGRFGSNYICKNCGLPISAMDYDTHIEFDDMGRPMMGRSEIVDEDALEEEEMLQSLTAPIGTVAEHDFGDKRKNQLYELGKIICDRIGVFIDMEGYKMIIDIANQRLSMQPSPKRYAELTARKKSSPDYATHMSRLSVALVSCLILIDIQSHVPDYVVRYVLPGCKAGFDGFPLKESADPTTSTGIQYMACALNGMTDSAGIFNQTGWGSVRSDSDRELIIQKQLVTVMQILVEANPTIQINLQKKRDYHVTIYGKEAGSDVSEKIPDGFLPRIETEKEAIMEATASPTVTTGARGSKGDAAMSHSWIRAVNAHANETGRKINGTPFAETGCCFSKSDEPHGTIKSLSLPALPQRLSLLRPVTRSTWSFVNWKSRKSSSIEAEKPNSITYKIFMTLCYKGERVGLGHEFGYDMKCDWCGLKIPSEYIYPDVDKYGTLLFNDDALIASFTEQGIPISPESFESLLDIAHRRQVFKPYMSPMPVSQIAVVDSLRSIENPPVENWSEIILNIIENIQKLAKGSTEVEIAGSLSALTDKLVEAETFCKETLKSFEITSKIAIKHRLAVERLDSICNEPTLSFYEILRTFFLIPCARITTKYNRQALRVKPFYDLSPDHREDIATFMDKHTIVLQIIEKKPLDDVTLAKIKVFVEHISSFLAKSKEIRNSRLPFGKYLIPYLNRIALYGPLYDLLNPNVYPEGVDMTSSEIAPGSRNTLLLFMIGSLDKYSKELLSYNSETIRNELAKEIENEKNGIIKYFDDMSDEAKRVELAKKKLGIGRWSIGGTKLIWAYNQDQYDKEREEEMGKYDNNGVDGIIPEGHPIDLAGLPDYGAEYDNENNGYDHEQEAEDDF